MRREGGDKGTIREEGRGEGDGLTPSLLRTCLRSDREGWCRSSPDFTKRGECTGRTNQCREDAEDSPYGGFFATKVLRLASSLLNCITGHRLIKKTESCSRKMAEEGGMFCLNFMWCA